MDEKKKLDASETGLVYHDKVFMVGGYIEDYGLSGSDTPTQLTTKEFKENRGYVSNDGYVFIYRKNPDDDNFDQMLPWFTVVTTDNGNESIQFNAAKNEEIQKAFHINRVRDLFSVKRIEEEADPTVPLYDEAAMIDALNGRTSKIRPISKEDDFLKKLVKTVFEVKGKNPNCCKNRMDKAYQYSNLLQGINSTTKTSTTAFNLWMELADCDFIVMVKDRGTDQYFPLKNPVVYRSDKDEIEIMKDGDSDANSTLRTAK